MKLRLGNFRFADFRISGIKANCHNFRTSDDIDIELAPVTKLDKKNKKSPKKITITTCQYAVIPLSFFQIITNLEPSRSRIRDAESVKLRFLLKVTFYLTNTVNKILKSLAQLLHYCFE